MTGSVRVDQAIYGVVRQGHALRCASGDLKLANELSPRLDLPDTAPPGADWSPFVSGFPVGDRYIVARTFSDGSATRAGMVITHALIGRLDDLVELDDLRPIFAELITGADQAPVQVEPLEITISAAVPPLAPDLPSAARLLVAPESGPVVKVGVGDFEELAVALWGQLWPLLRRRLAFRLSFGPGDIVEALPPAIVCTPLSQKGRWPSTRLVGEGAANALGAALLDGSGAGIPMRQFARDIGARLDSFERLRRLEQAYGIATRQPDTLAGLIPAVRLVQMLSDDPEIGKVEKDALIDRLAACLPGADAADMLTLRNLAIPGFASADRMWAAVEAWFGATSYPEASDGDLRQAAKDSVLSEEVEPLWRAAVRRGLESSSRLKDSAFPAAFWRWIEQEPDLAPPLVSLAGCDRASVRRLVAAAPATMPSAAGEPVLRAAAEQKLYDLHAATAAASLSPEAAASAQSRVEPGEDLSSMRLALGKARPGDLLDVADRVDDARVLRLAVEAVAQTPALLAKRDMSGALNRRVWLDAIIENPEAWRGPADSRHTFDCLLGEAIDGLAPPMELIERLSMTPLADVTTFARRKDLWQRLPSSTRERLLTATVDAWFAAPNPDIEPQLVERIVTDTRLNGLLSRLARDDIPGGLRLVMVVTGADDSVFRRWVGEVVRNGSLSAGDADVIGQSVAALESHETANDLVAKVWSGRWDLKPALRHCAAYLHLLDRVLLGVTQVTDAEKRDSLVELAAGLYPSGPDHEHLWERAGGKNADLMHHGSGIVRWREAIQAIQNGRKPTLPRLIDQMRLDYPNNAKLRIVAAEPLFRR
ncbi:effector-associated domain EAD1-containing protein [Brevundimonas sp.]|uniref:GAP1-N1 domain-containing protein n=1 Tax=Brevundimonas sp. TaxID=1871086 RepID=UPI0028A1A654|nr:effector-associated domain EAD1-containing protein [Brevundimonas sp.]